MTTARAIALFTILSAASFGAVVAACDDSSAVKEAPPDAGPVTTPDSGPITSADAGGDGGSDCFMNPKTHFEIINACTDAKKVTKNPTLPLLYPDGGLPPLQ